jgi:4-aminobutyrate aminotransferase-like enzyme
MGIFPTGSIAATHSGNPLSVAASLASLRILRNDGLIDNARILGEVLKSELYRIQDQHPGVLGCVQCEGLVAGIQVVKPGTKEPNGALALKINEKCFQKGLLMFSPAGVAGECVKMAPPLMINEEALREGVQVLEEVCNEVIP